MTRDPASVPPPPAVSVVVLTFNEEVNVEECLRSCAWCDDVHVLDSGSTDRTRERAAAMGARVHVHPFESFGRQRNWAIDRLPCRHDWHFHLDADERFTPELVAEIRDRLAAVPAEVGAFLVPNKMIFMGRWLRHAAGSPASQVRLFHRARCRFVDFGHGQRESCPGFRVERLRSRYVHYNFSKGLTDWFHKHNGYSTREAAEAAAARRQGRPRLREVFDRDPTRRRRAMKHLSYFLGGRAVLRFLYTYALRLGFLDGRAGFHYAAMISMYEYWTELKVEELEHPWAERNERLAERLLLGLAGRAAPAALAVRAAPVALAASTPSVASAAAVIHAAPATPAMHVPSGVGNATDADAPLVEVLIPTFNEAAHVAVAVRSAAALGPVFVLDSRSTDGTRDLARAAGATVLERAFTDYAGQTNRGLDHLPFRAPWVFILDADERVTPGLAREVAECVRAGEAGRHDGGPGGGPDGYHVNRLQLFMGRVLRHGGRYPSWDLRLFRRGRARYERRAVRGHVVCDGPVGYLRGEVLHVRRETVSAYLARHVRYADLESDEWIKWRRGRSTAAGGGDLVRPARRFRQWFRRRVWPVVPGRPLWRLAYVYVVRLGFLDGRAGWHLARLTFCYEYMTGLLYRDKLRDPPAGTNVER